MIRDRFTQNALEQLNEDELSLLYLLYSKLFDREHIDLRSVFVEPVLNKIRNADNLNNDGCKIRDSIVQKIINYYS